MFAFSKCIITIIIDNKPNTQKPSQKTTRNACNNFSYLSIILLVFLELLNPGEQLNLQLNTNTPQSECPPPCLSVLSATEGSFSHKGISVRAPASLHVHCERQTANGSQFYLHCTQWYVLEQSKKAS